MEKVLKKYWRTVANVGKRGYNITTIFLQGNIRKGIVYEPSFLSPLWHCPE
jgi:hypothetical protein